MPRRSNREARIRANPDGARFDHLDTILQGAGFDREETGGSHKIYRHRLYAGRVTLSPHNNPLKGYQVKQALAALDEVRERESNEDGNTHT